MSEKQQYEPRQVSARSARAQMLLADCLGGGEEWMSNAIPASIVGGVITDRSPTYVYGCAVPMPAQRKDAGSLAFERHMNVLGIGFGKMPSDFLRIHGVLRGTGLMVEINSYQLWYLKGRPIALVPPHDGPCVLVRHGRLVVTHTPPWTNDEDRSAGLHGGDRLARLMIWEA